MGLQEGGGRALSLGGQQAWLIFGDCTEGLSPPVSAGQPVQPIPGILPFLVGALSPPSPAPRPTSPGPVL